MTAAYESEPPETWQGYSDRAVAVLAVAAVVGVWAGWSAGLLIVIGLVGAIVVVLGRHRWVVLGAAVMLFAGAWLGDRAWERAEPRAIGPFAGWATLMTDPAPVGRGVGVVVEIEGERFQTYAYGSARRRLERRQAGERVAVVGRRAPLAPDDRRSRVRHVVGRFEIDRVAAWTSGTGVARASNRLRGRLRWSAEAAMPRGRCGVVHRARGG